MYSFSQNFEDVYIRRAFADVGCGFYIDAGAYDPVIDSVTKMLYDTGWHGINLEPGPSFPTFACRTRDINLSLALSKSAGEITFHYNPVDPGTSTTVTLESSSEQDNLRSYNVPCETLTNIVEAHAKGQHIHFLKLDIEGSEWDVLSDTDWYSIRPELILAESTLPYTNVRRDFGWADCMRSYDYEEVFFDGINTYFLRKESLGRREAFSIPVNVLDGVRKYDFHQHGRLVEPQSDAAIGDLGPNQSRLIETSNLRLLRVLETDREAERKAAEERGESRGFEAAAEAIAPLKAGLERERKLVEALEAERSVQLSHLQDIGSLLSLHLSEVSSCPNIPQALISEIASKVARLAEERETLSQDRDRLRAVAEQHVAGANSQALRADGAEAQVKLLKERLNSARDARFTMIEVTDRLTTTLVADTAARHAAEIERLLTAHEEDIARQQSTQEETNLRLAKTEQLVAAHLEEVARQRSVQDDTDRRLADKERSVAAYEEELSKEFVNIGGAEDDLVARVLRNGSRPSFWRNAIRFRTMKLVQAANAYRDQGFWTEAAFRYAAAYAQSPDRWDLGLQLSNMLTHLGAFASAERTYRQTIAKAPTQGVTFFHFGHMLETSGRLLQSRFAYQKAVDLLPEREDIEQALDFVIAKIERKAR